VPVAGVSIVFIQSRVTRRDLTSRILITLGTLTLVAMGTVWLLSKNQWMAQVPAHVVPTGSVLGVVTFALGSTMRGGIG
jgi:uncharacterized membrane protein